MQSMRRQIALQQKTHCDWAPAQTVGKRLAKRLRSQHGHTPRKQAAHGVRCHLHSIDLAPYQRCFDTHQTRLCAHCVATLLQLVAQHPLRRAVSSACQCSAPQPSCALCAMYELPGMAQPVAACCHQAQSRLAAVESSAMCL